MKINEIILKLEDSGYYVVGDSHAVGIANAASWNNLAKMGVVSSDPLIIQSLSSIPPGSVVLISVGHNDATGTKDSPENISSRIVNIVKVAMSRDLIPVYVGFPAHDDRSIQVKNAILKNITIPVIDLQNGSLSNDQIHLTTSAYNTAATQVSSKIKPVKTSLMPQMNKEPIGNVTSIGSLNFAPGVDTRIDPELVKKVQQVFSLYGNNLQIVSGYRSPTRNKNAGGAKKSQHLLGKAVDVNTKNLSHAERIKLIQIASKVGITGIGVYKNNLHFDIGPRRSWGPSYTSRDIPAWASQAISTHLSS